MDHANLLYKVRNNLHAVKTNLYLKDWENCAIRNYAHPKSNIDSFFNLVMSHNPEIKTCLDPYDHNCASYDVLHDCINMLHPHFFTSWERYASVLAHEMGHWTMKEGRLNRPWAHYIPSFYSIEMATEELIAEFVAIILAYEFGFLDKTITKNLNYAKIWLNRMHFELKDKVFTTAVKYALDASKFLLSK
jgi:hypothetical protein